MTPCNWLLGAKNLVLGGVSDLEGVITRGERLPTWGEMGWATFDAVILVGGIGAAVTRITIQPDSSISNAAPMAAEAKSTPRERTLSSKSKCGV